MLFIIIIIINNNHHIAMTLQSKISNRQPEISDNRRTQTLTYKIILFIAAVRNRKINEPQTERACNTC